MATSRKPARRATVRIIRTVIDKDTIGIKVTPVKSVRVIRKAKK